MVQIEQKHYEVIRQYVDLLEVVEEGFDYIEQQYKLDQEHVGDRIMGDVFLAFSQFESANQSLLQVFQKEQSIVQNIHMFNSIIEIVEELESNFQNPLEKKRIVLTRLIPSFSAWNEMLKNRFKPYIQH